MLQVRFHLQPLNFFSSCLCYYFSALADLYLSNKYKLQKIFTFFKSVGNLTYSSYLLHFPIQILVLIVFQYFKLSQDIFYCKIMFLVWMLVVIVASVLSFRYIEMPAKNYLRKSLPARLRSAFDRSDIIK